MKNQPTTNQALLSILRLLHRRTVLKSLGDKTPRLSLTGYKVQTPQGNEPNRDARNESAPCLKSTDDKIHSMISKGKKRPTRSHPDHGPVPTQLEAASSSLNSPVLEKYWKSFGNIW